MPTLSWLSPTDHFLHVLCGAGAVASVLLVLGRLPAASSAAAWVLYLSVAIDGQVFLEFQWDYLLLEAGFLAIWLAPPLHRRFGAGVASAAISRWLLRWLLFRLMFSSGWVKLASGDASWRHLTALRYHYETQPLPPWTAWFLHQMPPWFQTVSALFMFFVELVVPFLFFAPRRVRTFAFRITVLFQVLIAATGNYAFFNALAITLAVLLVDDQSLPQRWARAAADSAHPARTWPRAILVPVAAVVIAASAVEFAASLDRGNLTARARRRGDARARRDPQLQRLRALHGHDDGAARDRRRGQPGRVALAAVRVPIQAGRSDAPAALRRAAPAEARLADVVRGARRLRAEPLGPEPARPPARGISGGDRAPGEESRSRETLRATSARSSTTTASPTRGAAPHGRLVEAARARPFLPVFVAPRDPSGCVGPGSAQTPKRSALQARPSSLGGAM